MLIDLHSMKRSRDVMGYKTSESLGSLGSYDINERKYLRMPKIGNADLQREYNTDTEYWMKSFPAKRNLKSAIQAQWKMNKTRGCNKNAARYVRNIPIVPPKKLEEKKVIRDNTKTSTPLSIHDLVVNGEHTINDYDD
jgi:hypothetical protein